METYATLLVIHSATPVDQSSLPNDGVKSITPLAANTFFIVGHIPAAGYAKKMAERFGKTIPNHYAFSLDHGYWRGKPESDQIKQLLNGNIGKGPTVGSVDII